jgi:uncharacterized protein YdhG (YjbR/CyaY superfamily)
MSLEERVARIEGILGQMDKRLNHLESEVAELRSEFRAEFRELRSRIWWVIGIQISMWITIILAIIFR